MKDRLLAPAAMATVFCLTTTASTAQTEGTMTAEKGWSSVARCAQEDTERARHTCLDRLLREAGLLTPEMHAQQQRRAFGLDDRPGRAPPTPAAAPPAPASSSATASTAPSASASPTAGSSHASRGASTAPDTTTSASPGLNGSRTANASSGAGSSAPATTSPVTGTASAGGASPDDASSRSTRASAPDRLEVELAKVDRAVNGRLYVTTTDGAVWLQTETVDMPQPPVAGDRMTIRKGSLGGYRCSVASTHLTYRCIRNR